MKQSVSDPRHRFHFVPDTWVTLSRTVYGRGVDAVESEFGGGRAPSLRGPQAAHKTVQQRCSYPLVTLESVHRLYGQNTNLRRPSLSRNTWTTCLISHAGSKVAAVGGFLCKELLRMTSNQV